MSPTGSYEEFVHVETAGGRPWGGNVIGDYLGSSKGERWDTFGLIIESIQRHHPKHHISATPTYSANLIAFAEATDEVTCIPHGDPADAVKQRVFIPPRRRYNDETGGGFADGINFAAYDYKFNDYEFLVYIADGAETALSKNSYNYILVDTEKAVSTSPQSQIDALIKAATSWSLELHNEILVFDQGFWQPNRELWSEVQKSEWKDVILEEEKKSAIIEDIIGFFDAEKRYDEFSVPWKRGVIFYGPPGNGKTISTKALMHDVSKRTKPAIESLYVKSFSSYMGPEYGIRQIFLKARQMAPCLLIFEDIDSLVNVSVRSYFLNEVDGLESNHGILMIGSTNHLERLDPGIAKRPSRFDRKYVFDNPSREERIQYAEYWRSKLKDNKKIDFPKEMSARIADITKDFSFAYMKEAFVAALLVIVAKSGASKKTIPRASGDPLSDNELWNELKRQVENLRKEMSGDDENEETVPVLNRKLKETSLHRGNSFRAREAENSHLGFGEMGALGEGSDRFQRAWERTISRAEASRVAKGSLFDGPFTHYRH
ncbi:P-loop containing nucleoside triphosphate hydrolase protein [Bisporella sp. PMI_857]|nr:P-loop containing nucleoside triphosphate hydrolase protein [Bisporella sp. PMI_857]